MPRQLDLSAAPKIDLRTAKGMHERQAALFVDVRSAKSYEQSHIPGAVSIPIGELARRLQELPRDKPIIFY
ncbi:MAG: rhodanese-like domain-containing protein [Dehalococcoidales bacterium]|nr:rhodanese-like domain-containing protein [Dehalococcoidales bacterium]